MCVCVCVYDAERVVRLLNDFPTTMREKTSFDAEAAAKSAAMQKMVFFFGHRGSSEMLGQVFWMLGQVFCVRPCVVR